MNDGASFELYICGQKQLNSRDQGLFSSKQATWKFTVDIARFRVSLKGVLCYYRRCTRRVISGTAPHSWALKQDLPVHTSHTKSYRHDSCLYKPESFTPWEQELTAFLPLAQVLCHYPTGCQWPLCPLRRKVENPLKTSTLFEGRKRKRPHYHSRNDGKKWCKMAIMGSFPFPSTYLQYRNV
jgi:hypothetical protein